MGKEKCPIAGDQPIHIAGRCVDGSYCAPDSDPIEVAFFGNLENLAYYLANFSQDLRLFMSMKRFGSDTKHTID